MKKLIVFLLFICYGSIAYNQVIKGTIFDNKTKEKIYSASIYFSGTSVGTLADQNGNFQLDVSRYPNMPLTISAIGYYSVTLKVFSTDKPNLVYMNPKLFELTEVVVNAKSHSRERRENLTTFRNEFLGTTGNAINCEITNEDDIRFKYSADKDTLKAFALKPILITNKALGYQITYYLDKFEYYKPGNSFFFMGNIIFSEDSTKKMLYERKRKNTYLGSRMHFFRALWVDDLNSSGFTIKNSANETLSYKKIVYQQDSHTKYLRYHGSLGIEYYSKQPTSFINFLKESVYFDANGYFEPYGISWDGEMSMDRIADMLPYDYTVGK
jgi:hypothetical protein